jgi:hypothetical protein
MPELDRIGRALSLVTSSPIASELETRPVSKPAAADAQQRSFEHSTYIALREADPVKEVDRIRNLRNRLQQAEDDLKEVGEPSTAGTTPKVVEAVQARNALEAELERAHPAPSKPLIPSASSAPTRRTKLLPLPNP